MNEVFRAMLLRVLDREHANVRPSGANASALIDELPMASWPCCFNVAMSQNQMRPSAIAAAANVLPSGEKAIANTGVVDAQISDRPRASSAARSCCGGLTTVNWAGLADTFTSS